jgi:hypothetical protein
MDTIVATFECPRCANKTLNCRDNKSTKGGWHKYYFYCTSCGLMNETARSVQGPNQLFPAYHEFCEEYKNDVAAGRGVDEPAQGGGPDKEEYNTDYEGTVFCSFHGNVETPLQYFSDLFNEEFWSGVELMQSVQFGCLSYPETEDLLTGLFSDEIGNKKTQYQQFVKPFRQQKLASLESKNKDINEFLNLIDANPKPTSEPKSDYYQPLLIFVNDLLVETPKKTCTQIIKTTLDYIDTLISLQPHKYWGYKWFVTHHEPERKGEKYKTLKDLQMHLKKITKCDGLIEKLSVWLSELRVSFEEYHYIYYVHPIETGSIFKIYPHPETQPLQSFSGKKSDADLFNRGVSLILYPNTKLYAAFEMFCVEASDFLIENNITKDDLYAEFKTKEGSLISSPNMKLFCHWLMEKNITDEETKEEMRKILENVTHDFNLIDSYSITSFDIFKFVEIINTCLKIGWGETKKIKVIVSTCRVTDERMNLAVNPHTTATEDTQPDWNGGKTIKRRKTIKKTRKHK